ncbi:MAG: acyltransferase family protein [Candidatus Roizmanbacteria bacterium]
MRNPIFDLLRIVLTLFIVNVHIRIITASKPNFLEPYTWYAVPLFIVLSFFFSSNKNLISRIKRLFIPLIFWSIVGFIIHPNLFNLKNIFLQILTGHVVNTPLYYLTLLIWFTIINWLINNLPTRVKIIVYSLVISASFFLEYSAVNYNFFSPMVTVVKKSYGRFVELIKYIPVGLAFAYLIKKVDKSKVFFLLSGIFFVLFVVFSKIPQSPDFHYSGLKIFAGTVPIFSFSLAITQLKFTEPVNRFISFFGKYSFGVYLSHYLLLELLLKVFPYLKPFILLNPISFLIIFTASVYLFCFLFDVITQRRLSFLVK